MTRPLAKAAAVLLAAIAAPASTANIYGQYFGPNQYYWRVMHMPDFDQRRALGCTGRVGLPNNGAMYCVPTSTINLAAYVANRGYPNVIPGADTWSVDTQARYNAISNSLTTLGFVMGTQPQTGSGGGTVATGTLRGKKAVFPGAQFAITQVLATNLYAPRVQDIAFAGMSGSLVNLAYGRYEYLSTGAGQFIQRRTGGHMVTGVGVIVTPSARLLLMRDPADDASNCTQSPWRDRAVNPVDRFFTGTGSLAGVNRFMTEVGRTSERLSLIDSVYYIRPYFGLWSTGANLRGVNDTIVMRTPEMYQPNPGPSTKTYTAPFGAITDFDTSADWLHHYVLTTVPGPFTFDRALWRVDAFTGDWQQIASNFRGVRVKTGRQREVYVLTTTSVRVYEFDADPPTVQTTVLPAGVVGSNMTLDDETDQVIVYENANKRFHFYSKGMAEYLGSYDLPGFVDVVGSTSMGPACDGSFVFASEGVSTIYRIGYDPDTEQWSLVQAILAPQTISPTNVTFDDRCNVLFTSNGVLGDLEFVPDVGRWRVATSSPLGGTPDITGRFVIGRSRTNIDPAIHDDEEDWFNIDPDELDVGELIPDCLGDVNGDRVVDFEDLSLLLADFGQQASWLAADLNQDWVVDFDDLSILLANFGVACD
ncbi:MAG: hypothetical protein EA379_11880 [Phycisphaerales bacterium]|nr:MAG: hypothetical protein EA379_11880 [Phycisphaerales bacterium]